MLKVDPRDRPSYLAKRERSVGAIVAFVVILVVLFGVCLTYWRTSSAFSEVYRRLNINPLPLTIELQPRVYGRLDQLRREPCYQDALIGLSDALLDLGYPRESAM